MVNESPKVTVHMVSSLDGFISKKDNDISWMHSEDHYKKGILLSEEYISDFLKSIDCYVMGSVTYEHALEFGWPYGDKAVFVLTSRNLKAHKGSVKFLNGHLETLVNELKLKYKNIWMVGGSKLTKESINLNLVDKIVITIAPIILGEGTLFFNYISCQKN